MEAVSRVNLRERTVVINFSETLKKPKIATITEYIFKMVGIPTERLKSVQVNLSRGVTYVEVDSEEYALELVEKHDKKHEVKYEDYKFVVPLYMEDGTTQVRIHDLPPQMDNQIIKREMENFGEVLSVKDEVWEAPSPLKGIRNGVRNMRIHNQIPSYVNIAGHFTLVTHKNQMITCRHCCKPVHIGLSCAEANHVLQNRTSVNSRLDRGTSSYAGQLRAVETRSKIREDNAVGGINVLQGRMINLNEYNKEQRTMEANKQVFSEIANAKRDNTKVTDHKETTKAEGKVTGNNETKQPEFKVPTGEAIVHSHNAFAELMQLNDEDGNLSDTSFGSTSSNANRKRSRRQVTTAVSAKSIN